ncbi:hypothetical protein JCM10207_002448 [Rhodosporidiobolus poonsookiae]
MIQLDLRLSVSDAAEALYPRGRDEPPSLAAHYLPIKPTGFHPPTTPAQPSPSHDMFFRPDRESRLQRGDETRKRVLEVLRHGGVLLEPGNLEDHLSTALVEAQLRCRREKRAIYISPGLIAPPDLSREYRKAGYTPVQWANFKPALLKVEQVPGKKDYMRVTVIGIKSTHPQAIPGQVYAQEEFQLYAYRFFLTRLLEQMQKTAKDDHRSLLNRLSVSRKSFLWRYTGCYSVTCSDAGCFLNRHIDHITVDDLPRYLSAKAVEYDPQHIKDVLFRQIPEQLFGTGDLAAHMANLRLNGYSY